MSRPEHFAPTGWALVQALRPQPRQEQPMTTTARPDMYEDAYHRISTILDRAIGTEISDGPGAGLAEEVALLGQRYLDLRRVVLSEGGYLPHIVTTIEAAELRDEWWEAP